MPTLIANNANDISHAAIEPSARSNRALTSPVHKQQIGELFSRCDFISLEDTNKKARMLDRVDRKYIVNFEQFRQMSRDIHTGYSLLSIDGLNQFTYASCYYDDNYLCYHEHHQGKRQRVKVRTREYVDCGLMFFEIKLKGLRGQTNKHRIKCDQFLMSNIGGAQLRLLNNVYTDQYRKPMAFDFSPSLLVGYTRTTLVAREGSERVTIDYGLTFTVPKNEHLPINISNDFIIIESKSNDGMGTVDRTLKEVGIHPASKCSKYCLGAILTGSVERKNMFLPTIRKISPSIVCNSENALQAVT